MEVVHGVTKLNGDSNWNIWKFQILITAEARGFEDMLTGKTEKPQTEGKDLITWKTSDSKAKELIVSRMEEGPMIHIVTCKTASEMWEKLLSIYE